MSFNSLGFLVFSYSCDAWSMSFLYLVRSLYMVSIISGRNPRLSLRKNAPFGVIQCSVSFRALPSSNLSTSPVTGSLGISVSGDMLYCMIRWGYSEFKSKLITHLCIPTCGSLTYAPSNFSDFSCTTFCGMTMFLSRR